MVPYWVFTLIGAMVVFVVPVWVCEGAARRRVYRRDVGLSQFDDDAFVRSAPLCVVTLCDRLVDG